MGACCAAPKEKRKNGDRTLRPLAADNQRTNNSLVNDQIYVSNKGEDIDSELRRIQALGGDPSQRRGALYTEGQTGPILSIASEGYENLNPLKTNISASRGEILMIEDGGNKSSKEKHTISDGRQSSIGREIFNSKPRDNRGNQTSQNRENLYRVTAKRIGYAANDQVFNSTPNAPYRAAIASKGSNLFPPSTA